MNIVEDKEEKEKSVKIVDLNEGGERMPEIVGITGIFILDYALAIMGAGVLIFLFIREKAIKGGKKDV